MITITYKNTAERSLTLKQPKEAKIKDPFFIMIKRLQSPLCIKAI